MSSPSELMKVRNNIAKKIQGLPPGDPQVTTLMSQWRNANGKLLTGTLRSIHDHIYNNSTQTVKTTKQLQNNINKIVNDNKGFGQNTRPILALYKDYAERINNNKLASTQTVAEKNALALRLAKEKNSLKTILNNKNAALQAALKGRTADAAAFEAKAKASLEQMEAAHKETVTQLEQQKQLQINRLKAKSEAIKIQARRHKKAANDAKKLVNQAAINLAAATARGNTAAAKAAELEQIIAQRKLEAEQRNAQIAAAEAALVQAQQNAATASAASAENKAAALKSAQAEFNRQLAANKAAAESALANALSKAAANKNSAVAQEAARAAKAEAKAAAADQKVSELKAAVNAGKATVESLEAAKRNANVAKKEANARAEQLNKELREQAAKTEAAIAAQRRLVAESSKLRTELGTKTANANRLASKLANTSARTANFQKRFIIQAIKAHAAEAKASRAGLNATKHRGNAEAAQRLAAAKTAEANAARVAAAAAAAATEAAKRNAALASERAATAEGNAAAQTQAALASAAAVAAAQAEKEAAEKALVALRESSSATQANLNAAQEALRAANANKRATANKHAANMTRLKENANSATASAAEKNAALKALEAARAANKAAANKALANLKVASAQNVTKLQRALNNLNARRQAELEAKGTEKEEAVASARIAAQAIAAAQLKDLQTSLKEAQKQVINISGQKASNLIAQKKAAEAQAKNLQNQLNMAMKKLTSSQRNKNAAIEGLQSRGLAAKVAAIIWKKAYGGQFGYKVKFYNVPHAVTELKREYPNIFTNAYLKNNKSKNFILRALRSTPAYTNTGQLNRSQRITRLLFGNQNKSIGGQLLELAGQPEPEPKPSNNKNNNSNSNISSNSNSNSSSNNGTNLINRIEKTISLIGNRGNNTEREKLVEIAKRLETNTRIMNVQQEFLAQLKTWAEKTTTNRTILNWVTVQKLSPTNFNKFVTNYLGKLPSRPAPPPPPGLSQLNIIRLNGIISNTPNYGGNKWTNDNKFVVNMMVKNKNSNKVKQARKALNNKKNSKALVVRTPNAVPASAGPNFTNITVRWLNNWKRYSNDELIKGVNKNGKVNPVTASGQTRLKLLNIVRNANKSGIFSPTGSLTKPGTIAYFVKKYKNDGEKNPYLKWLIEAMIGPQLMPYKNSPNYKRALQWVRKVHGINAGTLNVNKYNQYINNSYLPNGLKQALLKHKQEILNKRGSSGTVLGTPPAGNSTVLGVPSTLNSKNVVPSITTSGSTIGKPPSILNTPAPAPASASLKNRIEQYRKRLQNATNYNNFKKVRNDPNVPRNVRLNSSIRKLISAREAQEKKRQPPQKANIRMVGWVSSEKPNPKRKSNKSNYSMKYIDGGYYIQVNGKYRPVLNYNKNTKTARISLFNKNIQGTFKAQKGKANVLAR